MAEFNSTTFGTISGRHGSAVAATIKKSGKSILKVFRAPSNPQTDKQVSQRTKFAFVLAFMIGLRELFKITFRGNGGYHHAVSLALKNAVMGDVSNFSIDFSKLFVAGGSAQCVNEATATVKAGTTVKIDWVNSRGDTQKLYSSVNFVFFIADWNESVLELDGAESLAKTAEIELPADWAGQKVHCWMYHSKPDATLKSASYYISEVQL